MTTARAVSIATALGVLMGCGGGGGVDTGAGPSVSGQLVIEDLVVGDGATVAAGNIATVHYVGTLTSGARFDSSYDSGTPFSFVVGAGQVIAGWDQGVPGMRVGGVRRLTIPPNLAYGSRAVGAIPPNSTLIFEIELLAVQ